MLLGLGKKSGNGAAKPSSADDVVFDVGTMEFEDRVMRASLETPVIVDFWASWCGPCKQLMPLLEQAVRAAGGKIKLAKVNIDENQQLAAAMRIQSVPVVFAFFQGQPVDGFAGAKPQSEIKAFIDRVLALAGQAGEGDALDIPATLKQAVESLTMGDVVAAQESFIQVLAADGANAAAYTGLVKTFIAAGKIDEARHLVTTAPVEITKSADFAAAKTALELAESAPKAGELEALRAAVGKNQGDLQARFDYGVALFAAGQKAAAIDEMVEIIRRNRTWDDDKARQQLLKFFEVLGFSDPDAIAGRRKLSAVLFS